jgi:hypothetical protein
LLWSVFAEQRLGPGPILVMVRASLLQRIHMEPSLFGVHWSYHISGLVTAGDNISPSFSHLSNAEHTYSYLYSHFQIFISIIN